MRVDLRRPGMGHNVPCHVGINLLHVEQVPRPRDPLQGHVKDFLEDLQGQLERVVLLRDDEGVRVRELERVRRRRHRIGAHSSKRIATDGSGKD